MKRYIVANQKDSKTAIPVDAFQIPADGDWQNDHVDGFIEWAEAVGLDYHSGRDESVDFETGLGEVKCARPGDWIVKFAGTFSVSDPVSFSIHYLEEPQ